MKPELKLTPDPGKRTAGRGGAEDGSVTAGVPLAKFVPRRILDLPEIVMLAKRKSLGAESFRRLKTTLTNRGEDAQVIVVTSGAPSEGKSTVAINLALAFAADRDERTLLLDADLRRPAVGGWLAPEPKLGLSELLGGKTESDHAILTVENSALEIMPAGETTSDPLDLLGSDRARELVASLRERYRRIIVDTPPIVPFTDADAIASLSDGVLMVVRAGSTPLSVYQEALACVTSAKVLGTVFNAARRSLADWTRDHAKYYDAYYGGRRS